MKSRIGEVDASPHKQMLRTIIADYDLNKAICELVDNAIDTWHIKGRCADLHVDLHLDAGRGTINVTDDAGGVPEDCLETAVSPGRTGNSPTDEVIGVFGVGTMRAVVALAEHVRIASRHGTARSCMIEFDEDWLKDDDWRLPKYKVDDISPNSTEVALASLRSPVSDQDIARLREHLGATYAYYLTAKDRRIHITVNGPAVAPQIFTRDWAYPPKYSPRVLITKIPLLGGGTVGCRMIAGITRVSSPTGGEYGVYVYCNDRLITRAQRSLEFGFEKGMVGRPHPKISATRTVVYLNGPAGSMPWNTSKSAINAAHLVFLALRPALVDLTKYYGSLSRRLLGQWQDRVAPFTSGSAVPIKAPVIEEVNLTHLPKLPPQKPRYAARVRVANRVVLANKPWARAVCENMAAVELVLNSQLEYKNRLCIILLDSILEIAFKEYLTHEVQAPPGTGKLKGMLDNRKGLLMPEIRKNLRLDSETWGKTDHYYD